METLLTVFFGLLSVGVSWYLSTKDRRLIKKAEKHQKEIETIKDYTNGTGYKTIIRDSFHSLSYAISISLIALSVQVFLPTVGVSESFMVLVHQYTASVYGGAGFVLWFNFIKMHSDSQKLRRSFLAMQLLASGDFRR